MVADQMLDGLTQLFYAKGLSHAQRVEVGKCIDAMNRPEVNIRGTDPETVRPALLLALCSRCTHMQVAHD
jgi:hypothetical protein